ncbi:discoidin domain-containing protein [uncultured Paraglaciecola sp.]|uniref:discoidin domain-containing protein n=1 Tax=uncultured Paraglaciecola sp. TaxID=1765024 RepID=UPI0026255DD2|nr:discoidin domain-containing protein [uncultured Paraglaciecola sp.]
MNKLYKTFKPAAIIIAMGSLYGCGSGNDPVATDLPARAAVNTMTSADVMGSAVKGTLSGAKVAITQLNGADIVISSGSQTDSHGEINLQLEANPGFGIDSAVVVTVTADSATTMMCDAITCAGVDMGMELSGAPLTGSTLKSLAYVSVPYASSADGSADASFVANSLTTIASDLLENAAAAGKNISVRPLFELAMSEFSTITLKALGVFSPGSNVFDLPLISAESYDNFVVGQDCETLQAVDENGDPLFEENGDATPGEEVCSDVLANANVIKLSLVNAAFAHINELEQFNTLLDETVSLTELAMGGEPSVLAPIRERLLASVSAVPFLAELGMTADQVIDVELPFLDDTPSSGPVQEVTNDVNLASAIITARNRIGDGEAESFAFDGSAETKWLDHNDWSGAPSVEDPSWVQVQFAEAQAVSSLFMTSANDAPGRDPENFTLVASNDGTNWVALASFIGETFDERFERKEFRFSNGLEYTHYRLNITKNKGDDTLMQVAEIEFVGPIHASVDHTDPVGTGVITARNRIGDGEAESFAFDNNAETKWLDHNDWSGAPTVDNPSWVQVDFPQAVAVDVLGITSANDAPGRDPENFTLVGSNDGGTTWVTLGEWIGEAFDERFERKLLRVDNVLAFETYRLNITKNKGDDTLMQVAEFELIGPKVAGLNHGQSAGVVITGRNRIGDGEAEIFAFDGDANTKWLDHNDWSGAPTDEDPSWIQIQTLDAVAVNKLALTSANDAPGRDPENFNIAGSMDGTNWIVLGSWIGESFDDRFERKQFSFGNDLAFTYYRLNITKNKGDDTLMQVAEIEMLGPQYAAVDHSSAADAVYTARNRIGDGEAEQFVFDDNVETKWLDHNDWSGAPTVENPSWVQVDFDTARIVSSIAITSANDAPGRDPENFTLVGSNDGGVTWTPVASWIGESFDNRFERKLFEMGNGFAYSSYRLNITKNKGDDTLMQVAEIELIGPEL